MKKSNKGMRIGQLAELLNVEDFVVRFWEKEFNLEASRTEGGQRYYSKDDVATFEKIRSLLYDKGFTISGAKKFLESGEVEEPQNHDVIIAASQIETKNKTQDEPKFQELNLKILDLQKQLIKLRELL